jgi:hypothetical protein
MKSIQILVFLVFLFSVQSKVWADSPIKAEVDKASITTDEILTYKLTVISRQKDISSLKIPDFKGFIVISQIQSSSVSFQKEGQQTNLMLVFKLRPKQSGKIKIAPARVMIQGNSYTTEELFVEIKPGSLQTQPGEEESGPEIPDSGQPKYNL